MASPHSSTYSIVDIFIHIAKMDVHVPQLEDVPKMPLRCCGTSLQHTLLWTIQDYPNFYWNILLGCRFVLGWCCSDAGLPTLIFHATFFPSIFRVHSLTLDIHICSTTFYYYYHLSTTSTIIQSGSWFQLALTR